MDAEQKSVQSGEFQGLRPLSPKDMLARAFPAYLFTPKELIAQLLPMTWGERFRNWTNIAKVDQINIKNKTRLKEYEWAGWHPQVEKSKDRWLISVNHSVNLWFGIDALNLGLNNTIDFEDITLLPYIHFRDPKSLDAKTEGLKKYGVYYPDLILLNRSQVDELSSMVNSI